MEFKLLPVEAGELKQYKLDMQEAFQKGFEAEFGQTDDIILPESDIDQSLNADGAAAYKAVVDGKAIGGAVVVINEKTQHNHLDLLFVKYGVQSNGIGKGFGLSWKTCTRIRWFGKPVRHILKNVIFISM